MSKINQRIRFTLIRHRGTSADIPTFKLFKLFTSTLRKADSSIIILPFLASKQYYSSLSALNHIKTLEDNKLGQFFKSYHQQQLYSLGGYFHVSSEHTLEELIRIPAIEEWLDSHWYFIWPCTSQAEKMVKIGVLCYGSIFFFCKDLKQAILDHRLDS